MVWGYLHTDKAFKGGVSANGRKSVLYIGGLSWDLSMLYLDISDTSDTSNISDTSDISDISRV